jgi:outer membrane lipoprotein-sorting protein
MNSLLMLALFLQEGTAEDSFRRIEETLQKARSLSIKHQVEMAIGDQKLITSGTVLLKEGNRLRITLSMGGAGSPKKEASAVSDGSTVRSLPPRPGLAETEWATPKTLNESVTVALLRTGCFELHWIPARIHQFGTNPNESLVVSEFRKGDDDSGLRTLQYTLQEGSGRVGMKVWFDPRTWMLRKRVISVPAQAGRPPATVTETYETFTVNSDISDDVFKLTDK